MILSTGHYIQVRKVGTRAGHPVTIEGVTFHHTLHLVDFWSSSTDFDAGRPPIHTEDFETQWTEPHADPGSRMLRVIERYAAAGMNGGSLLPDEHWSDAPDVYGNLAAPSMTDWKAVTAE
jgi:hypothetical protein